MYVNLFKQIFLPNYLVFVHSLFLTKFLHYEVFNVQWAFPLRSRSWREQFISYHAALCLSITFFRFFRLYFRSFQACYWHHLFATALLIYQIHLFMSITFLKVFIFYLARIKHTELPLLNWIMQRKYTLLHCLGYLISRLLWPGKLYR